MRFMYKIDSHLVTSTQVHVLVVLDLKSDLKIIIKFKYATDCKENVQKNISKLKITYLSKVYRPSQRIAELDQDLKHLLNTSSLQRGSWVAEMNFPVAKD